VSSLFYWQYSGENRSAGDIVPAVDDSVSWHDAIQRKKSLFCQEENAVLLV